MGGVLVVGLQTGVLPLKADWFGYHYALTLGIFGPVERSV